ncbi:MAG TPA: selenoprotein [Lentisphaeria bacterium]|nr:selenoprotein [Lentisphaeria bacterium]
MNHVRIAYCAKCHWLPRACWMSQELLATFEQELNEVTLGSAISGTFQIHANDQLIWCRKEDAGFPDIAELKRRVRDVIAPSRSLGHLDRSCPTC